MTHEQEKNAIKIIKKIKQRYNSTFYPFLDFFSKYICIKTYNYDNDTYIEKLLRLLTSTIIFILNNTIEGIKKKMRYPFSYETLNTVVNKNIETFIEEYKKFIDAGFI